MRKEDLDAWFERCFNAVNLHRKNLEDSFHVWEEKNMFSRDRFRTVCIDLLGEDLSSDDIDDLWLFINGGYGGPSDLVDGNQLLNLNQLRQVNKDQGFKNKG